MDNIELDKLPDESKYYIPTIEEFHVGFNYEIWEKKLVYDKVWKFRVNKYIFNEKQVTQTFFNYNFIEDLREGKIKVKLLDKEDIESLGFISSNVIDVLKEEDEFIKGFEKNTYILYIQEDKKLVIYNQKEYDISNKITGNCTEEILFKGYIKNKSELRKLFKMLNID